MSDGTWRGEITDLEAAEAQRDLEPKAHPQPLIEAPEVSEETVTAWKAEVAAFSAVPAKTHREHTVHIDVHNGVGRLLVDRVDVSSITAGVTTMTMARQPLKVILELIPGQLWLKTNRAQVEIDDETRDLLTSLGWTPPGQQPVAKTGKDVQD